MSATQKKKLCWNCEGRVSLKEDNCPYCAVYLGPAPDDKQKDILAPPYRIVDSEEEEETIPASPYALNKEEEEDEDEEEISTARGDLRSVILPLFFLSVGSMSFLFGIILWVFSANGTFTLTWNGEYWYAYMLSAPPLLFLGWRTLRGLQDDDAYEPASEYSQDD